MTPRVGWRVAAAAVLVGTALTAFAGVARADPRPGAGHLWRKHLGPLATERFYPKGQIHRRFYTKTAINELLAQGQQDPDATPLPNDDGGSDDDGATPLPDDGETSSPEADPDVGEDDNELPALFPWAGDGGFAGNWETGLGYAALGLLGALVTIYLFLGESLPSMGGTDDVELMREELSDYKKRYEESLAARESFARGEAAVSTEQLAMYEQLATEYEPRIAYYETAITKRVSGRYLLGVPMYLLLGAGFAVLFSANLLQALLIGFGWPAIASRAGLKRKDENLSKERQARWQHFEDLAEKRINNLKTQVTALEKEREGLRTISDTLVQQVQQSSSQPGG